MNVVYAIKNTLTGKMYIGSTVNFEKRKREHLNALRNNHHHSEHLQRAWNKYGESAFSFIVLEQDIPDNLLRLREKAFIDQFQTLNSEYGYNVSESTVNFSASGERHPMYGKRGRPSFWKGKKIPEEYCLKMRKPRSAEGRANMRGPRPGISGEKNPMYGKTFSVEHRAHISEGLKGKFSGSKNPMYGTERSGENAGHKRAVIQCSLDGVPIKKFATATDAASETGATRQHISKCCQGKRNQSGGFRWKYAD